MLFFAEAAVMYFLGISGCLPHRYKIVIAGNHDLGFDDSEDLSLRGMSYRDRGTPQGYKLLTNCIYLQDSEVKVSCPLVCYPSSMK